MARPFYQSTEPLQTGSLLMKKNGRLIVCADDLGLHSAINRGIRKAYLDGVLTHASIMALGPEFDEAAELAKELSGLSVGVHLTLPGNMLGKGQAALLAECAHYAVRQKELAYHWRRQIARIINSGIRPTHLDGHQYVHCFPGIFGLAMRLAGEFGIHRVRWLRFPRTGGDGRRLGTAFLKTAQHCSLALHRKLDSETLSVPSIGFATSGRLDSEILTRLVATAAEWKEARCVEIICHPGDDNAALERELRWGYDWEGELNALCDNDVKSLLV